MKAIHRLLGPRWRMAGRLGGALGACALALAFAAVPHGASSQELRLDPAAVVGPDGCGECHKSSVAAWNLTEHATTFRELPRSKKAKEITGNLGIKRIKAESDCLTCHFTSGMDGDKVKPIAGISCESCHGAGKSWIDVHGDYGGKDVTRESETTEHRDQRFAESEAAGMIRPTRLYDVAANCYGCHTVPNERLVNLGGHAAGSRFELVAWTQGEVRHNVWYTKENDEASAERRRMMYIVGRALDLEFGLRGVAIATEKADYAVAMARRAKAAIKRLQQIAEAVSIAEVDEILAAAGAAKLKLNNEAALTEVADAVSAAARRLAEAHDGSAFAAIDSLIPGSDKYKGSVSP